MPDPMQTILATENAVERLTKYNSNFEKRRWASTTAVSSGSYTVLLTDEILIVDAGGGSVTLNLPAVSTCEGFQIEVIVTNSTNTVTLDGNSSETINGLTTLAIPARFNRCTLIATASGWYADLGSSRWERLKTVTAGSYTVLLTDDTLLVDASGGAVTINLPAVATCVGFHLDVIAINVASAITLDGNASETINGSATKSVTVQYRRNVLLATAAGWIGQFNGPI